ncbi:hypothetical protein PSU4_53640 [Pseudonocardia sulfidoxydans NBRC 16205]|uniref:DUF4328 domain-containing protein n=1 Tax=Pseudonocardia sulfidoxydans NBRC 16205 TaxID=1223511 RepID=A0A511DNL8_9PSEU|nr:DUF4328 domain-containing protein [Pseudonocardia sulfidoxydans]GEL26410.1 hypothetical protein PSU4_53640 [Pseudonocardia sulfidoxydans NBRC 16205]
MPPRALPPGPVACPSCGRPVAPGWGPCPYCARQRASLRWVATPPPGAGPPPAERPRRPYTGPPSYRGVPRWGFPALPFLRETGPEPVADWVRARALAQTLVPALWATAAVALLAAGAEIWRYVLLVMSRSGALSAGVVSASDMLVAGAGWLVTILGLLTGLLVVGWSVRASRAAAERAGRVPSRSVREIVVGWIVPVVNLSVPGSVLAEIEHGALDRPADERPRLSRQLLVWWAVWAVGVVLAVTVFALSFRTGVQARADGVVLHALVDLVAAAVAVLTAERVAALSLLLGPVRAPVRETLVTVRAGD